LGERLEISAGEGERKRKKGSFKAKRGKITDSTYGNVITTH
jgi:hypothetical protein